MTTAAAPAWHTRPMTPAEVALLDEADGLPAGVDPAELRVDGLGAVHAPLPPEARWCSAEQSWEVDGRLVLTLGDLYDTGHELPAAAR